MILKNVEDQKHQVLGYITEIKDEMKKRQESEVKFAKSGNFIRLSQIVLSVITTGTLIMTVFTVIANEQVGTIIGAILSTVLLIFNSISQSEKYEEKATTEHQTIYQLEDVKIHFETLIADFDDMDIPTFVKLRDQYIDDLMKVRNRPAA